MGNRRDFIRNMTMVGSAALMGGCQHQQGEEIVLDDKDLLVKDAGLRITGTFLDEISHDNPHQNWGAREWDRDFQYMKAIGIDTVIMIRSGYRKFITYPSKYLMSQGCYMPSVDLLDLFLRLADKYGMKFYFGLYDSGNYCDTGDMPIKFFPIKFDKLRLKLEAAKRCGYDKAITFEFSHFMSPQSAYQQAGHLYNRYREYFGI